MPASALLAAACVLQIHNQDVAALIWPTPHHGSLPTGFAFSQVPLVGGIGAVESQLANNSAKLGRADFLGVNTSLPPRVVSAID